MTAATSITSEDGTIEGTGLWTVRAIWLVTIIAGLVVAVAGFEVFLSGDRALLDSQGPLAMQPELARELEFRLLDASILKGAQTGVHILGMALFTAVALLIFWRRSRDWVVAMTSITLVLMGVALFAPSKLLAAERPAWETAVKILGVFDAGPEFWRSLAGISILAFALLFPNGRFAPAWTRWLAAAYLFEVALWTAFPGITLFNVARWPDALLPVWMLGLAGIAIYAQLYRYVRVSGPETRKQTRLVMISLSAIVGSFLLIWVLDPDLSRSVDFGLVIVTERTQAIYDLNVLTMLTVGVTLFPISKGVSVARYRLWDMDLIINRALVYGTMTGIIGMVLLGAVVIVGRAVQNTFGQGVGVGISALLMVVLFQPLRTRVQAGIDRRFYPQKYDAERTLDALAERVRDQVDLEVLRTEIRATIESTLAPSHVRLSLPAVDASYDTDHELLSAAYLAEANRPIETNSELLPADAAAAFTLRSIDVVVPLVSHKELTGVIEIGPRRDGSSYTALDLQLLRRLAGQSAPVIRYAELVAREAAERAARQSYEQELALAQKIQRDLLPRQLPQLDGWELVTSHEASSCVEHPIANLGRLEVTDHLDVSGR